jgi:hypothetical protein
LWTVRCRTGRGGEASSCPTPRRAAGRLLPALTLNGVCNGITEFFLHGRRTMCSGPTRSHERAGRSSGRCRREAGQWLAAALPVALCLGLIEPGIGAVGIQPDRRDRAVSIRGRGESLRQQHDHGRGRVRGWGVRRSNTCGPRQAARELAPRSSRGRPTPPDSRCSSPPLHRRSTPRTCACTWPPTTWASTRPRVRSSTASGEPASADVAAREALLLPGISNEDHWG